MKNIVNNAFTENKIQLIQSGKPYFNLLLKLIAEATSSIHIQTYIFNDDETGESIVKALKIASQKKVKIHLLVDGYASKNLSETFIENLKKETIEFRFFKPFFKNNNFYFGRRLHHKMIVVDAKYAIVGGMNIADRYNECPNIKAWIDFAVFLEGPIAKELCILCWKTWNGFKISNPSTFHEEKNTQFTFNENETSLCRIRRNDWVRTKNEISISYQEMFKNAEKQITIICSYFIPGDKARKLLEYAVNKGIKVRLILASQSDVPIAKSAERWMYDWLLRKNIEIYEYQPTVLHAKMCVVDESLVTIGSYNINNISAYASIELNIDIEDVNFAKKVTQTLDTIIKDDCIQVTNEVYLKTNTVFKRFYHWACYRIFRIAFFLCTFYFKQQE
ncbi:phospholipase D-like domain-containing protein [Flavobacterium psychrophilum]|uniref:phospholipase D-like domain-containing protein n=1 Tax=Flavobacterium psychrophilum TaxID=96345 RepID=UPI000909D523|nr:phosphatidylserine/phosphatidylglycerophosphate/cardiolipin synthase family protein [Flavobacterium psychrophilum]EKT2072614.1 phosphatidylserine/phosphatidylglycerophosphate/cardiolipin synthase family protein [Flavobacterium psychrophilum]EKT4492127.1 phosphatidylserine/phosphatidylglycerophosphate/cardiolipin synthase family protein [Flavobacterium psychrophilum]SHH93114.1 Probable phospholipase D/Transphosphatidylase [Flavobacterium psychrophilum]